MNKPFFFTIALLLGVSGSNGQTRHIRAQKDVRAERELRKLEREWLDADEAAVERIEAEDFTITYEDGSLRNKAQYLKMVARRGARDPSESQWTEDSNVRIYDDTAIITGRYLYKKNEEVSESRYTDTYIKRNGRWQVVASHLSILALGQKEQADKDALREDLIRLEKQSWEAWQKREGKFFQEFLSDDHVEVGFSGLTNKAAVVAGVSSPLCVVKSYAVDNFEVTVFDANAVLLTYHAEQDTTCGDEAVPSPVWISSLYAKRGGRWVNTLFQQTLARK